MSSEPLQTNRNGAIGDYAAFSAKPMSLDELLAVAAARKSGHSDKSQERTSKVIATDGEGFSLRRYILGSDEVSNDFHALDQKWFIDRDRHHCTALFGLIGPDDQPQAIFDIIEEKIAFVFMAAEQTVSNETVVACLNHLDVPASSSADAGHMLAELFDAYWSKDAGGWELREPQLLVKVSFARHCFQTRPTMSETVDVFLAPPPECDIADQDWERAYEANQFCRNAAWEEFRRFPQFEYVRPGFSSWMTQGDPQIVKVVDDGLDAEIDRLKTEMDVDATFCVIHAIVSTDSRRS